MIDPTSYLAELRRYARTLTGSQHLGDALVSLTLEDAEYLSPERDPLDKLKLFRLLSRIWTGPVGDHWRSAERERKRHPEPLQRQLNRLTPRSRQAYLLVAMERFAPAAAAQILEMSEPELHDALTMAQTQIAAQGAAKVLIIEDEPLIAVDLESIVADLGHTVVGICRTRASAVAKARTAKHRDVPAIFVTAFPERLLTGLRREPVFLITKPFRADMVRAVIGQALFWSQDNVEVPSNA
jgi:DNA-directed RNA polymerase specialized sigma24 family protein